MAFYRQDPQMALCLKDLLDRYQREGRPNLLQDIAITWICYKSDQPNPSSGYGTGWNSNKLFYPASIVKLVYALATEVWIKKDLILESDELSRAAYEMIAKSSNDATSFVLDILTGSTSGPSLNDQNFKGWKIQRKLINSWLEKLQWAELKGFNCCQKTWNEGPFGREKDFYGIKSDNRNSMTTDGTARIFESIMTNEMLSRVSSARLKKYFSRSLDLITRKNDLENQIDGFLGEGVPINSKLWSKAGLMSEVRHDAAWIEDPNRNPMLLVVFTTGEKLAKDSFLLPALSSELNKFFISQ